MTENLQADDVQSRQAIFVRCCRKLNLLFILAISHRITVVIFLVLC